MDDKEKQRIENMLVIEKGLKEKGYKVIAGIDEAGRGPLVGPVVAAAVVLPDNIDIVGINDSKKISEKKREMLYEEIIKKAASYGIGISDVDTIEKYNILNATKMAMIEAVKNLKIKPDYLIIDGNQVIDIDIEKEAVVSGDSKSLSVAAASIVAKVTRDRMIRELDKKYPEYLLAKNKGYGTKEHIEAIKKYGICKEHRPSFCKHFI